MKQLEPTLVPLPCPFCGEMPQVRPSDPDAEGDAWAWIHCDNQDCTGRPSCTDGAEVVEDFGHGYYVDRTELSGGKAVRLNDGLDRRDENKE